MPRSSLPRRKRGRAQRAADPVVPTVPAESEPAPQPSPALRTSPASGTRLSRRRFIGLVSAASAALVADPLRAFAQTSRPAAKRAVAPPRRPSPAALEEIHKQKGYAAQAVKAIMDFPLALGTAPAFVFRPLKPRGRR